MIFESKTERREIERDENERDRRDKEREGEDSREFAKTAEQKEVSATWNFDRRLSGI